MIEAKELSFSYGERSILRKVSFRACEGELIFLLGANGAGKTTLLRCLLGHLKGFTGQVLLDGRSITDFSQRQLAAAIAYIPQTHHMVFPYSVLDMVLMGTSHRLSVFGNPGAEERRIAREALALLDIEALSERSFQTLSGGEQQLVLIARAIAQGSRALMMDEPTSALDFGNQFRVLRCIAQLSKKGYTVLLSCHNPQHALLYGARVLALCGGEIVADGAPGEVLDAALLQRLYHVEARFLQTPAGTLIAPEIDIEGEIL